MKKTRDSIRPSSTAAQGALVFGGLWQPGIRLMSRLSFASKALIISLIFFDSGRFAGLFFQQQPERPDQL